MPAAGAVARAGPIGRQDERVLAGDVFDMGRPMRGGATSGWPRAPQQPWPDPPKKCRGCACRGVRGEPGRPAIAAAEGQQLRRGLQPGIGRDRPVATGCGRQLVGSSRRRIDRALRARQRGPQRRRRVGSRPDRFCSFSILRWAVHPPIVARALVGSAPAALLAGRLSRLPPGLPPRGAAAWSSVRSSAACPTRRWSRSR